MGISIEAKTPKSAPPKSKKPKSKKDAAMTMDTTEKELTKQKRVADVKRKIENEERELQLLINKKGQKTHAGKARLAKGGSVKKYSSGGGVLRKAK
jgi:hypothetical protein